MGKILIKCCVCGVNFERWSSQIKDPSRSSCSKECRYIWLSKSMKGQCNPNFGKHWTKEKKERQSKIVIEKMNDPIILEKVGSANRGKKFSLDRVKKMFEKRSKSSFSHPCSEKTKILIGKNSKAKFTPEFKAKFRKTMEERGFWIPLSMKDPYSLYCKEADWIEKMFDLGLDGIQLLDELGVFNAKTNKGGVVRDHNYSRRQGFRDSVFPQLLRHPANCRIIRHNENVSKSRKGLGSDCLISLDELFKRIKAFCGIWKENDICLEMISRYEKGERYVRGE